MKKVIAVDLGASNGRLILVNMDEGKLQMEELHRFSNEPIEEGGHFFWNISYIVNEIKTGLKKYVLTYGRHVSGIGFDTWGVDFGLVSDTDSLLEKPYSYRDTHTAEVMDEVHQRISEKELFLRTGVETAPINTIYQLFSIFKSRQDLAESTSMIITMPSLLGFLFTGEKYNEFSHASTTQLLNWDSQDWDQKIMRSIFSKDIPLAKIKTTNSIVGHTRAEVNKEIGLEPIPVINVPGHDTACALAAMPLLNKETVFMSCGTWVLIGVEVEKPIVTNEAYEWGFTNEGTIDRTYRLQKNNMGLWLLQQCKKEWEKMGESITYEEEAELIKEAEPFRSLIDPDNEMFFNPDNMIETIQEFCKTTNQPIPYSKGELLRCIFESLSLKYRWVVDRLEVLTNQEVQFIHMAGGGIQSKWLCQLTANATKRQIKTGPIEASAIGNALSQFIALGEVENLEEAREVVNKSFKMIDYTPMNIDIWDEVYSRFINYV